MIRKRLLAVCLSALGTAGLALISLMAAGQKAAVAPTPAQTAFFESKVRPVLLASCTSCHGKDVAQGGLRVDQAVPPAKAAVIALRVKGEGGKPRMPLGSDLPKDKIAALVEWAAGGAYWPSGKSVAAPNLMEKGKTH